MAMPFWVIKLTGYLPPLSRSRPTSSSSYLWARSSTDCSPCRERRGAKASTRRRRNRRLRYRRPHSCCFSRSSFAGDSRPRHRLQPIQRLPAPLELSPGTPIGALSLCGNLLSLLLLLFPTFRNSLVVSDLIFLGLSAAIARRLEGVRPRMALALGCASILLAMLASLLLNRPLPALPFIALSFLPVNLHSPISFLLKKS